MVVETIKRIFTDINFYWNIIWISTTKTLTLSELNSILDGEPLKIYGKIK